jgi:hypothetical protein
MSNRFHTRLLSRATERRAAGRGRAERDGSLSRKRAPNQPRSSVPRHSRAGCGARATVERRRLVAAPLRRFRTEPPRPPRPRARALLDAREMNSRRSLFLPAGDGSDFPVASEEAVPGEIGAGRPIRRLRPPVVDAKIESEYSGPGGPNRRVARAAQLRSRLTRVFQNHDLTRN